MVRGAPLGFSGDPFTLGIASGAPRENSVVLWTRLAPQPLEGGGMPDNAVAVDWQVSEDESFSRVVAHGTEQAVAALGHSVHAEARGLRPGRPYWYRFPGRQRAEPDRPYAHRAGGRQRRATTALRLRLLPAIRTGLLRRPIATWPRAISISWFHLGDYIYEKSWGSRHVRQHEVGIPTTLSEFRDRYALYKLDGDLQAAHAAAPWLAIWDDHEVADDYADDRSYTTRDPARFLKMRAAAYQAYYEHMPLPASARPHGPSATIYERYRFGDLLDIMLLDDRQYRSAPACVNGARPGTVPDCSERTLEERTMLGKAQEALARYTDPHLDGALDRRRAADAMAELDRPAEGAHRFWMDGWDGYPNARRRLLDSIATHRPRNPSSSAATATPSSSPTSPALLPGRRHLPSPRNSSGPPSRRRGPGARGLRDAPAANPHVKYARGDRRGYATVELTPARCTVGFEAIDDEKKTDGVVQRLAAFVVEDGVVGARPA